MATADKNIELIEMLSRNEENIAALYKKYADRFTDYKGFWNSLSAEELKHADKLRSLIKTSGSELFVKGRFNVAAIQNFSKHIMSEADLVKVNKSTLINGLSIAMSLEQSLIEQKYFEVYESDSAEIKQVLLNLAEDTRRHLDTVRQLWLKSNRK